MNPVVEHEDNKLLFKSTPAVSQLNSNPSLSKDRLTRVRQGVFYAMNEKYQAGTNENLFGIGSDCAVFFEQEDASQKITRSCKQRPSGSKTKAKSHGIWYLGRVEKMRRKIGAAYVEYKRGFSLSNKQDSPKHAVMRKLYSVFNICKVQALSDVITYVCTLNS